LFTCHWNPWAANEAKAAARIKGFRKRFINAVGPLKTIIKIKYKYILWVPDCNPVK